MNRQEQTEFNHLKKVNKNLRDKLKFNFVSYELRQKLMDTINLLIDNEIEQETYTQ